MNTSHLRYNSNICISGLTASGKTTHAHLLAGEFGLTYVSGSQIQLNFLGVSPIQKKDFWITLEAKKLWDGDQFRKIDAELLRIESTMQGCIFDTSTMPWRHMDSAFCIWLESDLTSRVVKSLISHRGRNHFPLEEYPARISEKDQATISLYRSLYGIEIGGDLSPFDMIVDISPIITDATLEASLQSINVAHRFIRAASAYHLTGKQLFLEELRIAQTDHPAVLKRCTLLD
jgi:cytidylate kinase